MHKEFDDAASAYYQSLVRTIGEKLKGDSRQEHILDASAFNFANPYYLAAGRHTLLRREWTADQDGNLVEVDTPSAVQPFVIVFGSAAFERADLEQLLVAFVGNDRFNQCDPLDELSKRPRVSALADKSKFTS